MEEIIPRNEIAFYELCRVLNNFSSDTKQAIDIMFRGTTGYPVLLTSAIPESTALYSSGPTDQHFYKLGDNSISTMEIKGYFGNAEPNTAIVIIVFETALFLSAFKVDIDSEMINSLRKSSMAQWNHFCCVLARELVKKAIKNALLLVNK